MSPNGRAVAGMIGGNFGRRFIGPERAGKLIARSAMNAVQAALDRTFIEGIKEYLNETGQNLSFVEIDGNLWTVTNDGRPILLTISSDCEEVYKKKPLELATEMGLSTLTEGPDYDRIIAATEYWAKAMLCDEDEDQDDDDADCEDEDDEEEQGN
jgi:hypothetical protein